MRLQSPDGGELSELDARPQPPTLRASVDIPISVSQGQATARLFSFRGLADGAEHIALGLGPYRQTLGPVLVRVHSECLTGDILGSRRCDCGPQLTESIDRIAERGGYLLYLRQEGRGIGLYAKIDAYNLQDSGMDTFQANRALGYRDDERDYTVAAQMLSALRSTHIDLLTNNPDKVAQLQALGIDVRSQVPTGLHPTPANSRYLAAKIAAGHRMNRSALPTAHRMHEKGSS